MNVDSGMWRYDGLKGGIFNGICRKRKMDMRLCLMICMLCNIFRVQLKFTNGYPVISMHFRCCFETAVNGTHGLKGDSGFLRQEVQPFATFRQRNAVCHKLSGFRLFMGDGDAHRKKALGTLAQFPD